MYTTDFQLEDVLITSELDTRPSRQRDILAERNGLEQIARSMGFGREAVFQQICQIGLELCNADSAGISVLTDPPENGFTWDALVGRFSPYLHGTAPRHNSPCGVSLDTGRTQLFSHPERIFEWMRSPGIPIVEGLVIPLYKEKRLPYGSIWVMKHEGGAPFTKLEAEIMTVLGGHVSAALQIQGQRAS